MTINTATLNQLPSLAKPQRKFLAALIATIPAVRGRLNYRNLTRYGGYTERTYARQFQRRFPWLEYHAKVIQAALPSALDLIVVRDASFILKSGKQTFGLDRFYYGCAGRAERSLEIRTLAVVDVTALRFLPPVAQHPRARRSSRTRDR